MQETFEEIIEGFIQNKIGISDLFLTARLAGLLQKHVGKLHTEDRLISAGIGNNKLHDLNAKIRGDKIHWLDRKNNQSDELEFLDFIEEFIQYLNKTCYTGINAYEFHFAVYDEGSFYKRHKDQFRSDSNRKFSLITYLNHDWVNADGGQLWVHQNDETTKIIPNNRKGVFFQSNELEHEVTIAMRARMSVTGWLKRV